MYLNLDRLFFSFLPQCLSYFFHHLARRNVGFENEIIGAKVRGLLPKFFFVEISKHYYRDVFGSGIFF